MLFNLIQSGFDNQIFISVLLTLPVILLALTMHELAHGYVAHKLGDHTAYQFGRLTLNPAKHLDPMGTLMMLLFGFGWAKPVPVNTRYFQKPRRDMALVSLAGPIVNLLLCLISYVAFRVLASLLVPRFSSAFGQTFFTAELSGYISSYAVSNIGGVWSILLLFFYYSFYLNATLAVFNLIPIPPLDGSRLLSLCVPPKYYYKLMDYERYLAIVLMVALFFGYLDTPLYYATNGVVRLFEFAIGWLPF